jgi:hypothetical protein
MQATMQQAKASALNLDRDNPIKWAQMQNVVKVWIPKTYPFLYAFGP